MSFHIFPNDFKLQLTHTFNHKKIDEMDIRVKGSISTGYVSPHPKALTF